MGKFVKDTIPEQQFYQGDKEIGPAFYEDLLAYGGLVGQHFSWIVPGIFGAVVTLEFFEDTPQDVIDGVLEVYELHDPAKPEFA